MEFIVTCDNAFLFFWGSAKVCQRESRRSHFRAPPKKRTPDRRLNLSRFGHGPLSLRPSAFCLQLIELRLSKETATHLVLIIVFNSAQETHKKQEIASLGTCVCSFRFLAVQTQVYLQTCDHKYVAWDKFVYACVLSPKSGHFWCSQRTFGCL